MKNIKIIICSILCVALTAMSILSVSATTNIEEKDYKLLGTETLPDNVLRVTRFGTGIEPTSRIQLEDLADGKTTTLYVPENDTPVDTVMSSTSGYELWSYFIGSGSNSNRDLCFNKTGGTYEKFRINLSDFNDYFNEDGTRTHELFDDVHNYNFTKEDDGHISSLIFVSGGYITFAAPDKDGYVEIYVSTDIGARISFKTGFKYKSSSGGGTSGRSINGLTIGDTNSNGFVSVIDATILQKYCVGTENISDDFLTKRSCDVNRDEKINIIDATAIQKFLVGK